MTDSASNKDQRSLFGEILDWMLTPLLLVWPVSLVLTWLVAQSIAGKPFDRALEYNALALAQLVRVEQSQLVLNLPLPAREILRADDVDMIFYQVLGNRGELLSGEPSLPLPDESEAMTVGTVRLRDDRLNGNVVRVAYIWVQPDPLSPMHSLVQVAETLEKRSVLATEIIKGVMLPQFFILPLAVLLVWLALIRGIKPLSRLEARIRHRKPDDLSPLDASSVPTEVAPLVSSMNDLLMRLKDSIANQKRFLADAAHQLKTPLAGLRMQADLALRESASPEDLKQSLHHIGRASVRATRTVNQLLSMARAESGLLLQGMQSCDLVKLAQEMVLDCLPQALDHGIDMGYEGLEPDSPNAQLLGNPTLLKELIRNLIENAIHYTPSNAERQGMVTVRTVSDPLGQWVSLQVEDNGPGISPQEREAIFEPFYRALGNEVDGTGLGLPIVREIAHKHGATVRVDDAHAGHTPAGARFSVRFPCSGLRTANASAPQAGL